MTLFDLIERGYFPKELPPPFNTQILAKNISKILVDWQTVFDNNTNVSSSTFVLTKLPTETPNQFKERKTAHRNDFISKYRSSKASVFSISKGKLSRRFLQIPNPKHYALLAEKVANNWPEFEKIFALSSYSKSYPIPETSPQKRSVSTFSKNVSDFRNDLLSVSYDKSIEVRVDISKFYATIYTHAIAWALLGKEKAKLYFEKKVQLDALILAGDLDAALYKFAEALDMSVRNCQERQSIGIPIGPDTSHIIAEAIACRLDSIMEKKFGSLNLRACRYYDDYYIYVSSRDEADKILKGLQLLLIGFQLEFNEGKVKIKEFPFEFEEKFTSVLFLFDFKQTNLNNSLKHYFSLIWGFAEKSPQKADWIFKYSLRIFEYGTLAIPKSSWKLFESLLFKTILVEPSILDIATRILITYTSYIDADAKKSLKNLIQIIINEHSPINHNFEISWALWLAKTFEIEIDLDCANKVIDTKDSIANLILLDIMKNTSLIKSSPKTSKIEIELKDNILFSEDWLLAYESVKKGWLTPANPNLLSDNLFFKILKYANVEFYDGTKQLTPYTSKELATAFSLGVGDYQTNSKTTKESTKATSTTDLASFWESVPSGLDA